jgi:hypothetical protein
MMYVAITDRQPENWRAWAAPFCRGELWAVAFVVDGGRDPFAVGRERFHARFVSSPKGGWQFTEMGAPIPRLESLGIDSGMAERAAREALRSAAFGIVACLDMPRQDALAVAKALLNKAGRHLGLRAETVGDVLTISGTDDEVPIDV